jgi:hypothetical protein
MSLEELPQNFSGKHRVDGLPRCARSWQVVSNNSQQTGRLLSGSSVGNPAAVRLHLAAAGLLKSEACMTDEFINKLVTDAAKVATLCVGVPEQELLIGLWHMREAIKAQISEQFGDETATLIAEAFVTAVHGRTAELEAERNAERCK